MAEGFEQCTSNAMNIQLGMGMAIYYLFMFKFIQIWDVSLLGLPQYSHTEQVTYLQELCPCQSVWDVNRSTC